MSDEEVIIKKPNVLGDERHIHPSFGMLSFNRISGGSPYLMAQVLNTVIKYSLF